MVAIYRPAGRRLVLGVTTPARATTKDKFKVLRLAAGPSLPAARSLVERGCSALQ